MGNLTRLCGALSLVVSAVMRAGTFNTAVLLTELKRKVLSARTDPHVTDRMLEAALAQ